MPQTIYVNGEQIKLKPTLSIGTGGEADVYDIGGDLVAKIYKDSKHSDLANNEIEQNAANRRLDEHQNKLPDLLNVTAQLPTKAIVPLSLVTNKAETTIYGYAMNFLQNAETLARYGEKSFRTSVGGPSGEDVLAVFRGMHPTLEEIHNAGFIIGDFNNLNILIINNDAYFIDVDSWQFANYITTLFTKHFVDPLLCDENETSPILISQHNENSDWYAYNVMLMQTLLFVGPYGGIYRPKNKSNSVGHQERPLRRITVFNDEVTYPKPAIPYDVLPDDLLQHFHDVFENDLRIKFPESILNNLRWTTCIKCGAEHACGVCPFCTTARPVITEQIEGNVVARNIFQTDGDIIFATLQNNELYWLYWKDNQLYREDKTTIDISTLNSNMRYRLQKDNTYIAQGNVLAKVDKNQTMTRKTIDCFVNTLPVFDVNNNGVFWMQGGKIYKEDTVSPKYLGDVCENQTLMWVGPKFGFGFYRAGSLQQAFIFSLDSRAVNDSIIMPRMTGQLIDSTCIFSDSYCWFIINIQEGSQRLNRCFTFDKQGNLVASAEAAEGDGSWLGTLRGKCAVGNILFAATDNGIMKIEMVNDNLEVTQEFVDTERFVNSESHIFAGSDGIYIVSQKEILLLSMQ